MLYRRKRNIEREGMSLKERKSLSLVGRNRIEMEERNSLVSITYENCPDNIRFRDFNISC